MVDGARPASRQRHDRADNTKHLPGSDGQRDNNPYSAVRTRCNSELRDHLWKLERGHSQRRVGGHYR